MRLFLILAMLLMSTFALSKEIKLTKDNVLVLDEAFTGPSVAKLIQEARQKDADLKSGYPMYLFLNTPGGSIQAGLELIEALKGLNRPIHTVTLFAASMGWQLLQHLGDRYVLNYGRLMSHKARGQIGGEFGGGPSQLDSRYGLWLRTIDLMDKQTVKRTNGKKTLKKYRSEYDNELWLNGAEAVEHGYADEVITVQCDKALDEKTRDSTISFFGMRINLTMSGCPIITYPVSVSANIRTNKGYMDLDEFLADGGKFGKKCLKKDLPPRISSYSGEVVEKGRKAELCAMDETLTFESIEAEKEKAKKEAVQKQKIVYMTFLTSGQY
jgi:ATP-dependent Clp protease protease subunit